MQELWLMNVLFLVYHGFDDASGITKKIHYQVKGLRENGHEVHAADLLMIKSYRTTERERWLHFVSGLIMIVSLIIAN